MQGGYVAEIIGTKDGMSGASFCNPGVNGEETATHVPATNIHPHTSGPVVQLGGSAHSGFQNVNFENDPIGNVMSGVYAHVQWSVYVEGKTHAIDSMVDYFSGKRHITNRNVVSCSESWSTGYYYPK
jgi:hypothetical protein